jgi:hypothetical protein
VESIYRAAYYLMTRSNALNAGKNLRKDEGIL